MDSENYFISAESCDAINEVLLNKRKRVVVLGSSTARALETSTTAAGQLKPSTGWTDKFMYPPYEFKITQGFVTNFHHPESTLLMLAAAFGGYEFVMEAYQEAIDKKYRFQAFGDAMLIL
jgi:S-adenosylmethionine:tRNA ribosyltransferase-isomerase